MPMALARDLGTPNTLSPLIQGYALMIKSVGEIQEACSINGKTGAPPQLSRLCELKTEDSWLVMAHGAISEHSTDWGCSVGGTRQT